MMWLTRYLPLAVALASFSPQLALADNPQEPGPACTAVSGAAQLGTVIDHLSQRTFVNLGTSEPGSFLDRLNTTGSSGTVREFLRAPRLLGADQTSAGYILLINGKELGTDLDKAGGWPRGNSSNAQAISLALALNVPMVLEQFDAPKLKALTGLGIPLPSVSTVVQSQPGGRAFVVTAIEKPKGGLNQEFVLNSVNRALTKGTGLGTTAIDPSMLPYAIKVWDVWLQNGNIVCGQTYGAATSLQQTGNVDFGLEFTLVAGNQPEQKALNVQYIGTGFTPLAPGSTPLGDSTRFKGANTLELDYTGALVTDSSAKLTGTAQTVAPATAVGQHSVAKTTGWGFTVGGSCGYAKAGPGCMVNASFSYTNSKTTTTTVAERVINASSSFGQNAQNNTEADHKISYLLSSTSQTSDTGNPINLPNNSWYGFFHHGTNEQDCFVNGGWSRDGGPFGFCTGGVWRDGREKFPSDDNPSVANWPLWTSSSAVTEGEAGYSMDPNFVGDLMYTATFTAKEGAFAFGHGSPSDRQADDFYLGLCPHIFGSCPWYEMHLYTNAFTSTKPITISANDVNFSGMPTCAEAGFQQRDVGIWEIRNETDSILYFPTMSAAPFNAATPTQAFYYASTNPQYALGVAETLLSSGPPAVYGVSPGQRGYVALCSLVNSSADAMRVHYNNSTNTLSGALDFDGSGNFIPNTQQPQNTVNPAGRVITLNEPAAVKTATGTTLSTSPNPSAVTEPVTFTATVLPQSGTTQPSGEVIFMSGAFPLGTATLLVSSSCPNAVCASLMTNSLPPGSSSVTAEYEGSVQFAPSTSAPVTQMVNQQVISTSTLLMSLPNPAAVNAQVTFTATVTPQANSAALSGAVTFNDGATQLGVDNLAGGVAKLTTSALTRGPHTITASYQGNTTFAASQSNPIEQMIQSIVRPKVVLTVRPNTATVGSVVTFTVEVSSPGGPVPTGNFTISDSTNGDNRYGNANLSNGIGMVMSSAIPAGTHNLVATYGGDGGQYYSGAQSNTVSLQINPASQ